MKLPQSAGSRYLVNLLRLLPFTVALSLSGQVDWSQTLGGEYSVGTNWVGGSPPGTDDIGRFNLADQTYTVTFENSAAVTEVRRLYFNSGDVTLNLDGKTIQLDGDETNPGHDNAQALTVNSAGGVSFTLLNGTIDVVRRGTVGLLGASGDMTVGDGGILSFGGDFLVGQRGTGSLLVSDGGKVSVGSTFFIGHRNGGNGTVILDGLGSTLTMASGTIQIAGAQHSGSTGTLIIRNGAQASRTGTGPITIASNSAHPSDGSIFVDGSGSSLTNRGNLTVGNNDQPTGSALVSVTNGGIVTITHDTDININANGMVTGNGTYELLGAASATGTGALANTSGTVLPGILDTEEDLFTGGIMSVRGNYTQGVDGTLAIYLGGTNASQYGSLQVSEGTATLNGALAVTLANDFTLGFDQFFHVLRLGTAGVMSGEFTDLDEGALVGTFGGVDLFVTYDPVLFGADSGGVGLYTVIPEPGTVALIFGLTALGMICLRRRLAGRRA